MRDRKSVHREHRYKEHNGKLNNRGLSLIELLIAMVILSIVSAVIYQSIVMSARTNSKARLQHKATSLAQDVMEGLKAESINNILHQFVAPVTVDDEGNETAVGFDIIPRSLLPATVGGNVGTLDTEEYIKSSVVDGKTVYDEEYTRSSDNMYYLYLKNVSMENTLFDVLVTLDGSPYVEGSSTNRGQGFNSDEVIQIPSMDINYDAVLSNCGIYDGEAEATVGASFNPANMKREIVVTIDRVTLAGLEANVADSVTVKYIYSYWNGAAYEEVYRQEEVGYNNSESLEYSLRNIFLFYPPAYDYKEDTIRIENPKKSEAIVYVIKQKTTDTNLAYLETAYAPSLYVDESAALPLESETHLTAVCTNLTENLSTGAPTYAKFYFNNTLQATEDARTQALHLNDLSNSQAKDKLMDVTVEVFRAGEGTGFTTPLEFKDQAGDRLAQITGSIRN